MPHPLQLADRLWVWATNLMLMAYPKDRSSISKRLSGNLPSPALQKAKKNPFKYYTWDGKLNCYILVCSSWIRRRVFGMKQNIHVEVDLPCIIYW